jgi:myosin-5
LSIFFAVTNDVLGLQTPRLKRLAEIVSAQAIAQQEKLEYSQDDINDLSDSEPNGA